MGFIRNLIVIAFLVFFVVIAIQLKTYGVITDNCKEQGYFTAAGELFTCSQKDINHEA